MNEARDNIEAAIARGGATAALLISHRDGLIEHMAALILITGVEGLRACAAGAAEAVIIAHQRGGWGEGAVVVAGEGAP